MALDSQVLVSVLGNIVCGTCSFIVSLAFCLAKILCINLFELNCSRKCSDDYMAFVNLRCKALS